MKKASKWWLFTSLGPAAKMLQAFLRRAQGGGWEEKQPFC
jgi:hypothetical protein